MLTKHVMRSTQSRWQSNAGAGVLVAEDCMLVMVCILLHFHFPFCELGALAAVPGCCAGW